VFVKSASGVPQQFPFRTRDGWEMTEAFESANVFNYLPSRRRTEAERVVRGRCLGCLGGASVECLECKLLIIKDDSNASKVLPDAVV